MDAAMTVAAVRPVTIKLDDETKTRLKRLGQARQRTPHWPLFPFFAPRDETVRSDRR